MVLGDLAPIMMYLLCINIIPGLNCTSPWFQTHYDALLYPKTKGKKLKPAIKLNHNIYIRLHEFHC